MPAPSLLWSSEARTLDVVIVVVVGPCATEARAIIVVVGVVVTPCTTEAHALIIVDVVVRGSRPHS